jgi:hypothetical protein
MEFKELARMVKLTEILYKISQNDHALTDKALLWITIITLHLI